MTQADTGFTGTKTDVPTGFFGDLSRRDMFGGCMMAAMATVAAPALAANAGANGAAAGRAEWDHAMVRYREARAAAQHFDRSVYEPAMAAALANGEAWAPMYVQDEGERLSDKASDAETHLMKAIPAPDLAALRWKLDNILVIELDALVGWSDGYVQQTIADVARLLGPAA